MANRTVSTTDDLAQLTNAFPLNEWFPLREAVDTLAGETDDLPTRMAANARVMALVNAGAAEYNLPTERIKLLKCPEISAPVSWRAVVSTLGDTRARCLLAIANLNEDTGGKLPGSLSKELHRRYGGTLGAVSTIANAIARFLEVRIMVNTGWGPGKYTLAVDSVQLAEALNARLTELHGHQAAAGALSEPDLTEK